MTFQLRRDCACLSAGQQACPLAVRCAHLIVMSTARRRIGMTMRDMVGRVSCRVRVLGLIAAAMCVNIDGATASLPTSAQRDGVNRPARDTVTTEVGGFTKYIMWIPGRAGSTWITEMFDQMQPHVIANMEIFSDGEMNLLGVWNNCEDDLSVCRATLDRWRSHHPLRRCHSL